MATFNILALILTTVIGIYLFFRFIFLYWARRNFPYVAASFPGGNINSVVFGKETLGLAIKTAYNDLKKAGHAIGGIHLVFKPVLVPTDPELIKLILTRDFSHFHDRGIYIDEKRDPISVHLFSLPGQKWRKLRSKLTPTFTSGKLKHMFPIVHDVGCELRNYLEKPASRGESIEIKDVLARFTTDVIGSCAFGIQCNSLSDPNAEFRRMGKRVFEFPVLKNIIMLGLPQVARILGIVPTEPDVANFFKTIVKNTIDYREKNNVIRNDFLQLLIELMNKSYIDDEKHTSDNKLLSLDEASAQAFVFFLGGFETSSSTLSFCLYELTMNSEIQEKLRDEVNRILKKHGGKVSYEALTDMEYMDMVINETLRKYPPIPFLNRECTADYTIPNTKMIVRKGTSLFIPILGLHYDPVYYPNPETFEPDRFSAANQDGRQPYTFLPFGEGPRICIGIRFGMIQTKVGLIMLLQNYKFLPCPKTTSPLIFDPNSIVLSSLNGIWVSIRKINEII